MKTHREKCKQIHEELKGELPRLGVTNRLKIGDLVFFVEYCEPGYCGLPDHEHDDVPHLRFVLGKVSKILERAFYFNVVKSGGDCMLGDGSNFVVKKINLKSISIIGNDGDSDAESINTRLLLRALNWEW